MAKDAKGHGSEARGGPTPDGGHGASAQTIRAFAAARQAAVHAPDLGGAASHQQGVESATRGDNGGQPFRMNSFTHEIVAPDGSVAARVKLGKNNGLAVDSGDGKIKRSGGMAIHDAVAMPAYYARHNDQGKFPAEHINGPLYFLTGKEFAGHTVRRAGEMSDNQALAAHANKGPIPGRRRPV